MIRTLLSLLFRSTSLYSVHFSHFWGILVLWASFYVTNADAQATSPAGTSKNSTGVPFITNYTPEKYNAHNQNWGILQDQRGVMYFANNHGVLEYDGVSWRVIPTKDNSIIRSLAKDETGRIYAGSFGEIGYLAPDSSNQLRFVSLLPHVPDSLRDFADVWQTIATKDGIYFVAAKILLRWDGSSLKTWTTNARFHAGFMLHGRFFVRNQGVGLMQIENDSLVMAPGGEQFAELRIMTMLPFSATNDKTALIGLRDGTLMTYDGKTAKPFLSEANTILKESQIYCGTELAGGLFALGTLQNGVVIIDSTGKVRHHLNKASGLQDETIWYLYPDRQGALWMGMHVGISRAEIRSPHTYFGEREGLEGSTADIIRHGNNIYAASSMGLYCLADNGLSSSGKFIRVENVSPQAWALVNFDDKLLAGTFDGVYEIEGLKGKPINQTYVMSMQQSQVDRKRLFVGLQQGLKSLYYENGKWKDEGRIEGIDNEILDIFETADGKVWLAARYSGMLLLDFSGGFTLAPPIMRFDTSAGIAGDDRNQAFNTSQGIRFTSSKGILKLNEITGKFTPDTTMIKGLSNQVLDVFTVNHDPKGNIWFNANSISGVAYLQPDGSYQWDPTPYMRIRNLDNYFAYNDPLNTNITWIACIDRIVRYDKSVEANTDPGYKTLVRKFIVNGDSVIFGGAPALFSSIILHNKNKSLRISYAAPTFDDELNTEYQYLLEGFDPDWSAWTTETYKDYTGLPAGAYRFLVRSRNLYQEIGKTAEISFRKLPPFYLTWWAYVLYAGLLATAVYILWQWNLKSLRNRHSRELKQVEFEKLKELDYLKSRFFADISHEFRTPLTLILGPVETLLAKNPSAEEAKQYSMIKRNAQRLLRLINQLLDLSKLETGKMKLELNREDAVTVVNSIVQSFESLVQSKNIKLTFHSTLKEAFLYIDRDKMEQVITNLISNAVKFTADGGHVDIQMSHDKKDDMLQIDVSDTGLGISPDQVAHVFDRFYQGSEASKIGEPGSGIGLALAKELVELHQGRITVSSIENVGTTFTICLPYKKQFSEAEASLSSNDKHVSGNGHYGLYPFVPETDDPDIAADNTLLLVEDNPDMRAFIRDTLSEKFRIIIAEDGQKGIEKAFDIIPDVIVSDVMMPHKDGLELCAELKADERTSHIPIILLTARADIDSRLAGLERGADEYLAKPFNREELLIRAQNLLEIRQRLRARYQSVSQADSPQVETDPGIRIEDAFLQKFRNLVEEHLSDSELEIDMLAKKLGMSRSQMFRKIKALTGQSPSILIRAIRLQKGKELLESTELNVSEVAYSVGFSAPAYFSDAFTETYGIRPSQVKK